MAIFYHYLTLDKYHSFLKQNRIDPILKEKFKENDNVVICSNCKSAFKLDIWLLYYREKHCEQSNGDTEEYIDHNKGKLYKENSLLKFKKIYIFYSLILIIVILSLIFYITNSKDVVNSIKIPPLEEIDIPIDSNKNIEKKILHFIDYWNKSINTNPKELYSIYLDNLIYFGAKEANSYAVLEQQRILQKYTKFYQRVKDIEYSRIDKNKYKIIFNRYITLSKKYKLKKLYTYLIVVNIHNKFRVSIIDGDHISINADSSKNNINYLKEAIRLYNNDKNYVKSKEYFEKAAKQGKTIAYRYLGVIYLFGKGVKENKKNAIFWLKKAINNNDSIAYDIYNKYIN